LKNSQTAGVDINGDLILLEEEIIDDFISYENTTAIAFLDCDRTGDSKGKGSGQGAKY
jgi:hypothetical protein